jgi:hypothetical protein
MRSIPLFSPNAELYKRLKGVIDSRPQDDLELFPVPSLNEARRFLNAEVPELIYADFSGSLPLLESPHSCLWLGHGGVIALCEERHTIDRINALRGADILVPLTFADIESRLPGVLEIIHTNRALLLRDGGPAGALSGSFRLHNSLFEAVCSVNLICNHLCRVGKLTIERKYFFYLPLYELLINAMEHGNCGISYDEKSRFLERGGCASDLIEEKCGDPAVASTTISLHYELHASFGRFVITDQGKGFDWRAVMRTMPGKDLLRLHGRGILIARETVRALRYNDRGNEVSLEIEYASPARAFKTLFS